VILANASGWYSSSWAVIERLAFKGIVEVRVQPPEKQYNGGDQVHGQHQGTPAFILPDMHMFVVSASVQSTLVASENHMAQRHGRRRSEKQQPPAQEKSDKTPLNLDNSAHPSYSAAGQPGERNKKEAQQRCRKRPQITKPCSNRGHSSLDEILHVE